MVRPHWKLDKMTTANILTLTVLITTSSFGKIETTLDYCAKAIYCIQKIALCGKIFFGE